MPEWIEIIVRTLSAIAVLFVLTKLLGKRQVSQLSLFEYITGITIGSLAAYVSLESNEPWYLGVISLVVWVGVSLGIEMLQLKSKKIRDVIDGKGTVLIKNGKVLEDHLKSERVTSDELLELLRKKNVFQVSDVEFAVMESSGDISVLLKKENQPLTMKHLGVKVGTEEEPKTVIMDGKIVTDGLLASGFNQRWLKTSLQKMGYRVNEVYLAQVDAYGQLSVDLFDDQIEPPQANEKALLMATLKKCQADLELFALATKDEKAKKGYTKDAKEMQQVQSQVKQYLL